MRARVRRVRFLVFSNDPDWCRARFTAPDFAVVDSRGRTAAEDMHLMSLCTHAILANSSFSWWAAWLKTDAGPATVVCPRLFMQGDEAEAVARSFYLPEWTRIDHAGRIAESP